MRRETARTFPDLTCSARVTDRSVLLVVVTTVLVTERPHTLYDGDIRSTVGKSAGGSARLPPVVPRSRQAVHPPRRKRRKLSTRRRHLPSRRCRRLPERKDSRRVPRRTYRTSRSHSPSRQSAHWRPPSRTYRGNEAIPLHGRCAA